MISDKIIKAMNDQIRKEFYSSYLYLSMASYLHSKGFDGMGGWMRAQAMEEAIHAMKFFDHLIERGGDVELQPIEQPPAEWKSPLEAFRGALDHERMITGTINDLYKMASDENDYASRTMLQWFIDEQIEEETNAEKNVRMLEIAGESGQALLMIDKDLGVRMMPLVPSVKEV
ncbi:MAG: ferritin [Candidatus Krumholzibacteriota bacterium]|nr:ferritin [Candidatus Krumholzibacteriota bacterium]